MLLDAIVLAGGRSSRLGGTPKALLRFEGRTLVDRAVSAAFAAGARRVVLVADAATAEAVRSGLRGPRAEALIVTREQPEFGGPAAAIAAGIQGLGPWASGTHRSAGQGGSVLVLACDVPRVEQAVDELFAAVVEPAVREGESVVAVDPAGHRQHLLGVYDRRALTDAVDGCRESARLDSLAVRSLLSSLAIREVPLGSGLTDDIDTWGDAAAFGLAERPGADRERIPHG